MEKQRIKKIYIVPNFVTTANMFCGFYSMIAAIKGDFVTAAWAILAASVFNARRPSCPSGQGHQSVWRRVRQPFGFDLLRSRAAILLHQWALEPFGRLGWLAAFLSRVGALRLARFNVLSSVLPKKYFQGLPIPMAAGVVATFIIFVHQYSFWDAAQKWPVLILTFGLASLMVSTIRFPSFKELNWRSRGSFGYLMGGVLAMVLDRGQARTDSFCRLGNLCAAQSCVERHSCGKGCANGKEHP